LQGVLHLRQQNAPLTHPEPRVIRENDL